MTRFLRVVLIVVGVVAAVMVSAWLALQSRWGEQQLVRLVEAQAERALDGEVTIARIYGNLLRGATIEGLAITREGQPLVSAERLQVRYDAVGLVRGNLAIEELTLVGPVVHLVKGPDGITLFDLLETDAMQPDRPARPYSIEALHIVDGRVVIGDDVGGDAVRLPDRLDAVQADLAVERDRNTTSLRIAHLSFLGHEPTLLLRRLTGAIRMGGDDVIFERVAVQTSESALTLDGSLRDLDTNGGTK